ncbi:hypothetical protein NicSoilB11_36290 [Arthrobacter sp. NicSoilB11]|nr:hypothetical protein NicSoilB11_36290 [Arthrobacter sp. NicSoilB11]
MLAAARLTGLRIGTQRQDVVAVGVPHGQAAFLAQDGVGAVRYQAAGGNHGGTVCG